MEFDLQRFNDGDEQAVDSQPSAEPQAEEQENFPIPEELSGIPEDIARETMAEWEESQPKQESEPAAEPQPEEKPITREDYQAKVAEAEQLKAELAKYQRQQQPPQQPQQQQIQAPQLKITPEISAKISEAIKAEAMALTGFSDDDIASLDYADDDDPRIAQWAQGKSIAQNRVYTAIQQAQVQQQQQAQNVYNAHMAATQTYNAFAQKEMAEPDFKQVQQFATNDFFNELTPQEQQIVASSYLRIERQTASPAEMLVVKNYFERAKAVYRSRVNNKKAPVTRNQAPQLPRSHQLRGAAGKGEITVGELERMLENTPFDKIPEAYQKKLLGY